MKAVQEPENHFSTSTALCRKYGVGSKFAPPMSPVIFRPPRTRDLSWGSADSIEVVIRDVVGNTRISSSVRPESIGMKHSITKGDRIKSYPSISTF